MQCQKYINKMYLYVSNEITKAERSEFEVHLSQCNTCKGELQVYRNIIYNYTSLHSDMSSQLSYQAILEKVKTKRVLCGRFWSNAKYWIPATAILILTIIYIGTTSIPRKHVPDIFASTFNHYDDDRASFQLISGLLDQEDQIEKIKAAFNNISKTSTPLSDFVESGIQIMSIKNKINHIKNEPIF